MGLSFGNWDPAGDEVVSGAWLNEMGLANNALFNDSGLTFPQKTTAQILAVVSPAAGLTFWNTDEGQVWQYDGTQWISFVPTVANQGDAPGVSQTTSAFFYNEVFNGL